VFNKNKYMSGGENMVKVTIELSEYEIQMLINCIDAALDTKHMRIENEERIKEIKKQFSKYL
jgi:hypothetical protein